MELFRTHLITFVRQKLSIINYQLSRKRTKLSLSVDHWSLRLSRSRERGFTLVELLVVIGILGVLIIGLAFTFNPLAQIQKAQDAGREHDLQQIKTALDTYFNDTGCYPSQAVFNALYGSTWSRNTNIYMQKVPEDPNCSSGNLASCYRYQTDTTATCPQWNILYAKTQFAAPQGITICQLGNMKNSSNGSCTPTDWNTSGANYCVTSGKVDCDYVSGNPIPVAVPPASIPTATPTPIPVIPTATPTPTPTPITCPGNFFSACSAGVCNAESQNNCVGYGGNLHCYCGGSCGGITCH